MKKSILRTIAFSIVVMGGCLLFSTTADAKDEKADLDCHKGKFDSGALFPWNKDKNKVPKGDSLNWHIIGKANTKATFEFTAKKDCEGTSPFDSEQVFDVSIPASGEVDKLKGPVTVTPTKDTCYNYKITCYNEDGTVAHTIDPIIEVPKP